jgi:hypothetical protein
MEESREKKGEETGEWRVSDHFLFLFFYFFTLKEDEMTISDENSEETKVWWFISLYDSL